jgi:hypothetical protein
MKTGGGPISRASLHRLLHDPFYTGSFLYRGELHRGVHEPMIGWETFDAVQKVLGRHGPTRAKRRVDEFDFAGLLTCGACGRAVSAEVKAGRHGKGAYVYYHCAGYQACKEKAVRQEVVADAVEAALRSVALDPEFKALAVAAVEAAYARQAGEEQAELRQRHRAAEEAEKRMSRLVQMGLRELISDEEFARERAALQKELNGLKKEVSAGHGRLERARDQAIGVVDFVTAAPREFAVSEVARRREIARALGAKFVLEGGAVNVTLHPHLEPLLAHSTPSGQQVEPSSKKGPLEPLEKGSGIAKETTRKQAVSLGWEDGTMLETFSAVLRILIE